MARICRAGGSSTAWNRASRTGSAAMISATSGAAPGTACIASRPSGDLLGRIKVPSTVSNLTFGGRNRSRLFLCASHTLYAIYVNRRGVQVP